MSRFSLKSADYLYEPDKKRFFNEKLFTEVAPRYDAINRILSFGRDQNWKKVLVAQLPPIAHPVCVDIACGTGDIAQMLAARYPDAQILALDLTEQMLLRAKDRRISTPVLWSRQDMMHMAVKTDCADILTGGYAIRNAPQLENTLLEINRVLRPGGIAAFLDFSKPKQRALQKAEFWLLKLWCGFWGALFHRNPEVYSYIAESLNRFPDRAQLRRIFREKGFAELFSKRFFFGVIEVVIVQKESGAR